MCAKPRPECQRSHVFFLSFGLIPLASQEAQSVPKYKVSMRQKVLILYYILSKGTGTALKGYVRAHKPGWVSVANQLLDRSPHIGLRGAVVLFAHGCPRMCGELGSQRPGLAARVRPHIIRLKLHQGSKQQHTGDHEQYKHQCATCPGRCFVSKATHSDISTGSRTVAPLRGNTTEPLNEASKVGSAPPSDTTMFPLAKWGMILAVCGRQAGRTKRFVRYCCSRASHTEP